MKKLAVLVLLTMCGCPPIQDSMRVNTAASLRAQAHPVGRARL
jgi:hypothetical protein